MRDLPDGEVQTQPMRFQKCGARSHEAKRWSENMADATGARSGSLFAPVVHQKSHPCFDILPRSSRVDILHFPFGAGEAQALFENSF